MGIRDVIEEQRKLPDRELVPVEGMKEKVLMRRLSCGEMLKLVADFAEERRSVVMILACLLDEQGKPVFSEPAEITGLPEAFTSPLADAAIKLNSPTMEEAEKNSTALHS